MSSVRSVPTFGAPLDAVSLRRRMRGRAAVGARPPLPPGYHHHRWGAPVEKDEFEFTLSVKSCQSGEKTALPRAQTWARCPWPRGQPVFWGGPSWQPPAGAVPQLSGGCWFRVGNSGLIWERLWWWVLPSARWFPEREVERRLLSLPGFPQGLRWGARVGFLSVADDFPRVGFAVQPERRRRRGRPGAMPAARSLVCSFFLKNRTDFFLQQPERVQEGTWWQQPSGWPEREVAFFDRRWKSAGAVCQAGPGTAAGSVPTATPCHRRVPAEAAPGMETLAWRRLFDRLGSWDDPVCGR